MTGTTATATYDRLIAQIERQVALLNEALGLSTEFDEHSRRNFRRNCVTFGYTGGLGYVGGIDGLRDDRLFFAFLPVQGRERTEEDQIGGFAHGDEDGARNLARALGGMVTLARWQKRGQA